MQPDDPRLQLVKGESLPRRSNSASPFGYEPPSSAILAGDLLEKADDLMKASELEESARFGLVS